MNAKKFGKGLIGTSGILRLIRYSAVLCSVAFFLLMVGVFLSVAFAAAGSSPMGHTIADEDRVDPADEIDMPQGFVLMFSGNWLAHLEPCGCSDHQLGGIDRRTRIINLVPPERRLLVDAGPLVIGWQPGLQRLFKLEAFFYSLNELNYDAITLTCEELEEMLWEVGIDPMDRPELLATNLDDFAIEEAQSVKYIEKTLQGDGQFLDCLILGLMPAVDENGFPAGDGMVLSEAQSLEQQLNELGIEPSELSVDILVIVTYSGIDQQVLDKLRTIPAIDLIVTHDYGDEPSISTQRRNEYEPIVLTTGHMGKYIAAIAVEPGSGAQLDDFDFMPIAVEDYYVRDQALVQILDDYQDQLAIENLIADENKLPRSALADNNWFVGSASCGQSGCHQEIYETWQQFSHAKAMPTLIDINRDLDPECVSCHVVGMNYVSGYRSMATTPNLGAVGCEMCHGPGLNHVLDTIKPYRGEFTRCEECHTHETSPAFHQDREYYFQQVNHWDQPRKWWY